MDRKSWALVCYLADVVYRAVLSQALDYRYFAHQEGFLMASEALMLDSLKPPAVTVEASDDAPVRKVTSAELTQLGQNLDKRFRQYANDRFVAEQRWLRNLRQYLGQFDPEIEKELGVNRSRAYPKVTRVKCVSILSRIMDLMFPGNERNWSIGASPSPDMDVEDVQAAWQAAMKRDQAAGVPLPDMQSEEMDEYVTAAVQALAVSRAEKLSVLLDDQLQELGGDQTYDYVQLNRQAIRSGIIFGLGVLRGPLARQVESTTWAISQGQPKPKRSTAYKPMFEFVPVWDFYPDMSAKKGFEEYFTRVVMSRAQVRSLAGREDFFGDLVRKYLADHSAGNYRPQTFETELRTMGVKTVVNDMAPETMKYEVIVWNGPVSGEFLRLAGCDVPNEKMGDDLDAEVWLIEGHVIKAMLNPWGNVDVKTIHTFLFDEDDASCIGQGVPNIMRDSQMSIAAATRMLLDNASVTCGPQLELNYSLLRMDQDLDSTAAYKIWKREDDGSASAQYPAVRNVQIDGHMDELLKMIELFMKFADMETFVGPATGGDMDKAPSEPMRTAAGASMLRGDAALPFKDIIRSFDMMTMSVIESLVQFNRKFNPKLVPAFDHNVIARGATSLIAKEVRGGQVDMLAATLQPEERIHVDMRKLVKARFDVRDLGDLLVTEAEAGRRQQAQDQQASQQTQQQTEMLNAEIRKALSDAMKNIAQAQKNSAAANAATVKSTLEILAQGISHELDSGETGRTEQTNPGASGNLVAPGLPQPIAMPPGMDQGADGGLPLGPPADLPGGGQGLQ